MVPKVYTLIWLLVVAAAAAGFYLTANFNEMAMTIFGFFFATLFFGFFVAVLPWLMDKQYSWKY